LQGGRNRTKVNRIKVAGKKKGIKEENDRKRIKRKKRSWMLTEEGQVRCDQD
jgi:hypothetical protein